MRLISSTREHQAVLRGQPQCAARRPWRRRGGRWRQQRSTSLRSHRPCSRPMRKRSRVTAGWNLSAGSPMRGSRQTPQTAALRGLATRDSPQARPHAAFALRRRSTRWAPRRESQRPRRRLRGMSRARGGPAQGR
eukprot:Amastigsp_a844558_36.p6 type:complete len:135 gc:universal Amastigsp_a844558_36:2295-1891(-)